MTYAEEMKALATEFKRKSYSDVKELIRRRAEHGKIECTHSYSDAAEAQEIKELLEKDGFTVCSSSYSDMRDGPNTTLTIYWR
jgi:hypothetical protein